MSMDDEDLTEFIRKADHPWWAGWGRPWGGLE